MVQRMVILSIGKVMLALDIEKRVKQGWQGVGTRKLNNFPNLLTSALQRKIPDFIQSVLHSQTHPLLTNMETHSEVLKSYSLRTIQKLKSGLVH